MTSKITDDLCQELMCTSNLDHFLIDHQDNFVHPNIPDALGKILSKSNISKVALAKRADISEIYLHQIFSGKRKPSRNRLICICCGLGATLDDTQNLLKLCGLAALYPKNRRDAIIIYALIHEMPLPDLNDKLYLENEQTLS